MGNSDVHSELHSDSITQSSTLPSSGDGRGYEIPPTYKDRLDLVEVLDIRTDDEILRSLADHVPVTSEKNIWAFWHAGVQSMPSWNQRNVIDWVRICGASGWSIRVLDSVPDSPNYAARYIDPELLPQAYKQGTMEGPWAGPHSADLIRGACLWTHGGVCMDVGCILIRDLDRVCWSKLTEPGSPYSIAAPHLSGQRVANYFVAARKGDPFIKRWHDLFVHLWTDHTTAQGLADHPLLASPAAIVLEDWQSGENTWEVHVPLKNLMEYMTQALCWQRVTMLEDTSDGFSGVNHWMKHVYLFDGVKETLGGDTKIGFEQQKMFDYLTSKLNGWGATYNSRMSEQDYDLARYLCWYLLADSSMLKISRGPGLTRHKGFGSLLDEPENSNKHCQDGTYFGLLRYGSLHFRQKRDNVVEVSPVEPTARLRKGITEV